MKPGLRSLGLTTLAMVSLTVPALAHPSHGFEISGPLHSLLHALDAGGYVVAGLTLLAATALTIRRSRPRPCDPES